MSYDTIIILGIPVDNLTMDEAVSSIIRMVDDFALDGRARQVATVNVDFVVNTLTWRLKNIRHPELLDILRRADLVTADGMPIVWVSRMLGMPLRERVTGADLVPKLAEAAAVRGKSLYFLGGRRDAGQQAANVLLKRYPDLKIAGVYSPFVHVEGEAIAGAEDEDEQIVEKINRSGADILLIGFGNPKQEIWFDRNRDRLKVPVSIGIGGTYEFIVGSVSRAPVWMQKRGLEWIYRITQDPRRLIKRYVVGFFKFGIMVWPAVFYYRYRRFRYQRSRKNDWSQDQGHAAETVLAGSRLTTIRLPERLDAAFLQESGVMLEKETPLETDLVLDFAQNQFIDSSGLGLITKIWKRYAAERRDVYLVGVGPTLVHFLKLNRVWDLFSRNVFSDVEAVSLQQNERRPVTSEGFYIERERGYVVLRLFVRLDVQKVHQMEAGPLMTDIGNEHCIVDLGGLDFIDSAGLGFLIRLTKRLAVHGKKLILCELPDTVRQMLTITKIMPFFQVEKEMGDAVKAVERIG